MDKEQIDLHVHSNRSDGTLSPAELVDYALQKGLKAIALTDHDTVDGLDEIMAYAKDKPLEVIPGIEYSTEYHKRDVHIVGLFIDYKAPVFTEYLERFQQSRVNRNYKLCANLQRAGMDITYEALLEAFPDSVITRAHYAAFLLEKGYVNSRNEAFDRYLGDHTPYFVHREKITPQEVIAVTKKAGGIPILAHPTLYKLGREQLEQLVSTLKDVGLMGIETMYSTYNSAEERRIKELAKKYYLLESGGSDFHGENKPGLELGTGYGKLAVGAELLENMKKALTTKILFTDLDGTLLSDAKKDISAVTRDKILEMLGAGHHFVLASGRSLNSILGVLEELNILEALAKLQKKQQTGGVYAAAFNGAQLYDCIAKKPIAQYMVSIPTAQWLFDMAAARGMYIQTYMDKKLVSIADGKELEFYKKLIPMEHEITQRLENVLDHAPFKLLAIDLEDRARLEAFRETVQAAEESSNIICAFSNPMYLEFYDKRAGKGNALVNLCNALHILEKNAIAAGDEENDCSMIEAAGIGVAMANAVPLLKERADYITEKDNNHDGIVEVIERFIL